MTSDWLEAIATVFASIIALAALIVSIISLKANASEKKQREIENRNREKEIESLNILVNEFIGSNKNLLQKQDVDYERQKNEIKPNFVNRNLNIREAIDSYYLKNIGDDAFKVEITNLKSVALGEYKLLMIPKVTKDQEFALYAPSYLMHDKDNIQYSYTISYFDKHGNKLYQEVTFFGNKFTISEPQYIND